MNFANRFLRSHLIATAFLLTNAIGNAQTPIASRDACRFLTPAVALNPSSVPMQENKKVKAADDYGMALPTPAELFRVQSEGAFLDRLRQEMPNVKKVEFPRDVPFLPEADPTKSVGYSALTIRPVSGQVCYRPLYFEDRRTERLGGYIPCVQPLVSASRFYCGVLLLPIRMCVTPPWTYECGAP